MIIGKPVHGMASSKRKGIMPPGLCCRGPRKKKTPSVVEGVQRELPDTRWDSHRMRISSSSFPAISSRPLFLYSSAASWHFRMSDEISACISPLYLLILHGLCQEAQRGDPLLSCALMASLKSLAIWFSVTMAAGWKVKFCQTFILYQQCAMSSKKHYYFEA